MPGSFVHHCLVYIFFATSVYGYSFSKANFTRKWTVVSSNHTLKNLDVFSAHNRLIYKWTTGSSRVQNLHLQSIEIGTSHCNISVVRENSSVEELSSAVLGNGNILFWLRDYDTVGEKKCWRHYFVDPETCLHDAYRVNDVYDDLDVADISIVPYHNTFDALLKSSKFCTDNRICVLRFNNKGVNTENITIPYDVDTLNYELQYLQNGKAIEILYTSILANQTFHATVFNSKYEKVFDVKINSTVRAFSVARERLGFCKDGPNKTQLVYSFFYSNFTDEIDFDSEIEKVEMLNLASDRTITFTMLKNNRTHVIVHYIEDYKKPSDPVILAAHQNQEIDKIKYFEFRNGVHCITMLTSNFTFTTHCISPRDDNEFNLLCDKST
ncbi:hypothetical protein TSAR_011287 [Trichomalopsis sarcophagae]|uniref:Uncharacterized protein n=1 Tax=Trichomalopsis sarcophagae TaxID=543379 RepID=A0A232FF91_9HYME|nr:hypothetical protein TSAR_011287 [Trichomalopsis sarcophagae]